MTGKFLSFLQEVGKKSIKMKESSIPGNLINWSNTPTKHLIFNARKFKIHSGNLKSSSQTSPEGKYGGGQRSEGILELLNLIR